MRILYTGGGTGGHIYPILAVHQKILEMSLRRQTPVSAFYLGVPKKFSGILESNGIKVQKILSSKLRRYFDPLNLIDAPKFVFSLIQALFKIFWIMPDVVFSKGGPGALAVVMASRFYRIPVIIHESDTIPGLTNQISSKFATRVGVSFESSAQYFPNKGNVALVGNPIREDLLKDVLDSVSAKQVFGFDSQKPVILVVGGSQGSERINNAIVNILPELLKQAQIIHVCGENNFEKLTKEIDFIFTSQKEMVVNKGSYKLFPYLNKDIKDAYSASDLVIARSGSGTIFELAAFGKPSILIPLPESAGNHQVKNAYEYAKAGSAVVVEEANLTPNIFLTQITKVLSDLALREKMSASAKTFAKPDSAEKIAEGIFAIMNI